MEKIRFQHEGRWYEMTQEEIDAAYAYQWHRLLLEDADLQLELYVFGYTGVDLDDMSDAESWDAQNFADEYGVTVLEAKGYIEEFANRYEDQYDCNNDANYQWASAIRYVMEGHRS